MANPNSNRMGNNGGREYSFLQKPVRVDLQFKVAAADAGGLGITAGSLKGAGIQNAFMHTSATAGVGNNGVLNPNPANGYLALQLNNGYGRFIDSFCNIQAPLSGSNLVINATALTIGQPYVISAVGVGAAGQVTIAPVADVSGSLASKWFRLYDAYGNTYVVWFQVAGVGSAPAVGGTLVQISIASGATAATIGAQLVTTLGALTAQQPGNLTAPSGVFSFTASGTTLVTLVSTLANSPLPGAPQDGVLPSGFTFASTIFNTNAFNWQAVGLPVGVVPAVNAAFIAKATGSSTGGGSTGTVQLPLVSGIDYMEVVGDPTQSLSPIAIGGSPNVGGWLYFQFLASTNSTTTTLIPTAPANGSIVNMSIVVEAGSMIISGQ